MDDLISRKAAIEEIKKCRFVVEAYERIKGLPSAEVTLCHLDSPCEYQNADIELPTAEKVGKWIEWWPGDCALIMTGEEMLWMCSECNAKFSDKSNYCPNCGASMVKGADDAVDATSRAVGRRRE